jgi:hypothetical protein
LRRTREGSEFLRRDLRQTYDVNILEAQAKKAGSASQVILQS